MPSSRKSASPPRPKTPSPRSRGRRGGPAEGSRRHEIVEHAIRLMEEKGFAAMSVQHIADALEFSKANFYHHIDSKEDLLHEVFVETLRFSLARIEAIVGSGDSTPDQLRALIEFYVLLMTDRRAVMLVWFKERAHLTLAHQRDVRRLEDQIVAILEQFYARGIAEGNFKRFDVDIIRHAIFGMCFMLTTATREKSDASVAAITRQLQALACTGLLAS